MNKPKTWAAAAAMVTLTGAAQAALIPVLLWTILVASPALAQDRAFVFVDRGSPPSLLAVPCPANASQESTSAKITSENVDEVAKNFGFSKGVCVSWESQKSNQAFVSILMAGNTATYLTPDETTQVVESGGGMLVSGYPVKTSDVWPPND